MSRFIHITYRQIMAMFAFRSGRFACDTQTTARVGLSFTYEMLLLSQTPSTLVLFQMYEFSNENELLHYFGQGLNFCNPVSPLFDRRSARRIEFVFATLFLV